MGSEENGISPALWKACNETAKIPTSGETASLNVSVALGIALYEVSMQRRS
jgi:23S rRNA (guanosine2251-2'-O)-methyltransferase